MKLLKNVFQVVKKIPKEKGNTNEGSSLQNEAEHQEKMRLPAPPLGDLSGPFKVAPMQDAYEENSTPLISSSTNNNNDNSNTDLMSNSNSNHDNDNDDIRLCGRCSHVLTDSSAACDYMETRTE